VKERIQNRIYSRNQKEKGRDNSRKIWNEYEKSEEAQLPTPEVKKEKTFKLPGEGQA
jgi:hypothetical protein